MSRPVADSERASVGIDDRFARLRTAVPVSLSTLAGLLALVPVAGATLYRVVHNAPGTLPPEVVDLAVAALPLAVAGPAAAALLLAGDADSRTDRLGLAFVGAFGLVSLAGGSAWFPAAVGVCAGLAVVVGSRSRQSGLDRQNADVRKTGVLGVLTAGVVVSLAATAGLAPGTLRPVGSGLALVGVALLPAVVSTDRLDLLAGAVAGVATIAVAASVPYVAGAVLLVGGGVVGVPIGLVALAVGSGVAASVGGLRRVASVGSLRRVTSRTTEDSTSSDPAGDDASVSPQAGPAAVAPVLLVTAGVPGTLLRAVGVAVAIGLLAGGESP